MTDQQASAPSQIQASSKPTVLKPVLKTRLRSRLHWLTQSRIALVEHIMALQAELAPIRLASLSPISLMPPIDPNSIDAEPPRVDPLGPEPINPEPTRSDPLHFDVMQPDETNGEHLHPAPTILTKKAA